MNLNKPNITLMPAITEKNAHIIRDLINLRKNITTPIIDYINERMNATTSDIKQIIISKHSVVSLINSLLIGDILSRNIARILQSKMIDTRDSYIIFLNKKNITGIYNNFCFVSDEKIKEVAKYFLKNGVYYFENNDEISWYINILGYLFYHTLPGVKEIKKEIENKMNFLNNNDITTLQILTQD
jgi:hypothetical protein